jgi:hypothetical protein
MAWTWVPNPPRDRPSASASALLFAAPAAQVGVRMTVESINTLYKSGRCEHARCKAAQTPWRHQRERRLNTEFQWPSSAHRSHRRHPPRGLWPAPQPGRLGREHALEYLHHVDGLGGRVPLPEVRAWPTPHLSPPERPGRWPPVHLGVGLPPGPQPAHSAQGPGYPPELGAPAPPTRSPARRGPPSCSTATTARSTTSARLPGPNPTSRSSKTPWACPTCRAEPRRP